MTRQQDIETIEDVFDKGWKEIDLIFRGRLKSVGITKGALVRTNPSCSKQKTYRLVRIDTSVYASYGRASCALYGNQLRQDGTYGDHVHYIGRPHDVEVLK